MWGLPRRARQWAEGRGQAVALWEQQQSAFPKASGQVIMPGTDVRVGFFPNRIPDDFPSGAEPPPMDG
eukprot:11948071-Heterocapsa_arctica.AAC.1